MKFLLIYIFCVFAAFTSCSVSKQISKQASTILLSDTAISTGHIGISIYEPATNTYWYNYNATKNFIPASNTKLFTLYAGMKYLGDSLVGIEYQNFNDTTIIIQPTADPSFLHSDFKTQPVLDFLNLKNNTIYITDRNKIEPFGYGWAWDDYNSNYMAERNSFPIFGNIISISINGFREIKNNYSVPDWIIEPKYFKGSISNIFLQSEKIRASRMDSSEQKKLAQKFNIHRGRMDNKLDLLQSNSTFTKAQIPFFTDGIKTSIEILKDDLGFNIKIGGLADNRLYPGITPNLQWQKIRSQPSDSLFKPMMHRSDNFFAEQTLLMASNEYLGYMSDEKIIDTILKTSLQDVPQKPKWVDGSGLSRYNLCTPQTLVYLLHKMKNEFGWERIKNILPTGGKGTLSAYYKKDSSFIYAKTGTLSNNCALSGYLITKKGKFLIFSVLANNYQSPATPVRRAVEKFLQSIRENY